MAFEKLCGMLNNISWISYLISVSLLLVIYYLVVLLYYFRSELLQLARPGDRKAVSVEEEEIDRAVANSNPDLFPVVHVLMDKVGNAFGLIQTDKRSKEEMLGILSNIISQEHELKDTPFRYAISNFLREQALKQCAVLLSDDDLRRVWDG